MGLPGLELLETDIIDGENPMSSLMRILSVFEAAPIEPPHILNEAAFEQQLLREFFGMPFETPRLEIFFPIHIIHFIEEIPEVALKGNKKTFDNLISILKRT